MHLVTRRIACFCEKSFEAEMPDSVDLALDEGVEQLIVQGDFMAVECPACGKRLTPEFPCLVSVAREIPGPSGGREILLVPEAERVACMRGKRPGVEGHARIAIGMPELVEKVLVFGKGLDDRVVEIMKFYLLTGAAAEPEEDRDVTFQYRGDEGDRMVFHIRGLPEGEIGVARLSREIYRKIETDLDSRLVEEPFSLFCEPPYVSIRKAETGV
jgi:hypothetical protein